MDSLAFTTESGSTYVVTFSLDDVGIDVIRVSDHPVVGLAPARPTSFAARFQRVEFFASAEGLRARFSDAPGGGQWVVTSPIRQLTPVTS